MATMSRTWSIFTAVVLLVVQLCIGEKSCTIWSSAGSVVRRGSTFEVYCTFNCKCPGSMYSDHPPARQKHTVVNSTTICFNVVNITKNRTYSCQCNCSPSLDPCGLDISAGYLPDRPKNISCVYKVKNNESGIVSCAWNRGRDTYLRNSSELWVTTVPGDRTGGAVPRSFPSKGADMPSVSFDVSRSVRLISVWVRAQNPLGSAESAAVSYALSDIVMPSTPILRRPNCSSRACAVRVEQPVRTQHLEIQYRAAEQTWMSYPDQSMQMSIVQDRYISSLEPYSLYHFRARSRFSSGLWSQWSRNVSSWTQEEAPAKELDVWYAEAASDLELAKIYWKEANISISRGKIIGYKVRIYKPDSGSDSVTNLSSDARNSLVPVCGNCEVTVWSYNSKGLSPPARITARHTKAKSSQVVRVTRGSHNVTISWRRRETAPPLAAHVVEWYPRGHELEELRWVRLGGNDNHTVITDIQPFECYDGAVYVFYNESSVSRNVFTGVTSVEQAPTAGPLFDEKVEGRTLKVTWSELPRSQRGGCITRYTIYVKNSSGHQQPHSVPASERTHTIRDLPPDTYSLWMTASTAVGEGRAIQSFKFVIQQEALSHPLIVVGVLCVLAPILLCLCQSSAAKQKFWVFFQCLMLDVVPDPANSKWAKECTQEKGKMNLQLQLSNSSATEQEEEPILVDVEELPRQSSDISAPTNVSSQPPLRISVGPETKPATLLYPLTTYIKSFSHDSDSSEHTQTSLDTNTTVDYISSHGLGNTEEEEDEEEEEEAGFAEMLDFFPTHNTFIEPLDFGGKLTLDAVKIDCSNFFQNS